MGMTSEQAASLYRRSGKPVPKELHGEQEMKRHKYNARKKEVDGVVFDSTSEAEAYRFLKLMEGCNLIIGLKRQPEYVLQEGFRDDAGTWHRPIKYIGDFYFVPLFGGIWWRLAVPVVADVKGMKTPAFRLKEKMFRAKFPNLDLQIWDKAKVKELSRC